MSKDNSSSSTRSEATSHNLHELAAEWQGNEYRDKVRVEMLKQEVLQKVEQITCCLSADAKSPNAACDPKPVARLDWDELYEVSANVMDVYTKEVDDSLAALDKFYRKQYLWQEAAFTIDSHRGALRIGTAEDWMRNKEAHLEYMRQELSSSAQVIKKTIEELSQK